MIDRLYRMAYKILFFTAHCVWWLFQIKTQGSLVAVWWEGRILLTASSYRAILHLPGGMRNRGESALDNALREMREEVGLVVPPEALTYIGEREIRHMGHDAADSLFELVLPDEPVIKPDRREITWAGFMTVEDALAEHLHPIVRHYLEEKTGKNPAV